MSCSRITVAEYPNGFTSLKLGAVSHTAINFGAGCGAGVIRTKMRTPVQLRLPMLDESGALITLGWVDAAAGDGGDSSSSSSSAGAEAVAAQFVVRSTSWAAPVVDVEATQDTEPGYFIVRMQGITRPGLYVASLTLLDATGTAVCGTNYWLEVAASANWRTSEPLTISEIRLELYDQCAENNELLDKLQFTDEQVAWAIKKTVDEFNATGQPETMYTPSTFPGVWRAKWASGVCGYLCRTLSVSRDRNSMDYAAGGVQIREAGVQFLAGLAERLITEWREWVRMKKVEINVAAAWGTLGSDYGNM